MTATALRFIFLSCFSILFSAAYTQSSYQINHFTTENGLPSNGVKGLQWDEQTDFLWIATEAGLVRYNGIGFKTFDVSANPELGSGRIILLVKNIAGKILMSSEESNLTLIKNNSTSLYFRGADLAKYNFGRYGAVTASDTLFRQCFKYPWSAAYNFYNTTVASLNDTACVLLTSGRLYYYSVSTQQPLLIQSTSNNIKSAFKIANELFYLDSTNNFFAFDTRLNKRTQIQLIDDDGKAFTIQNNNSKLFWETGMENPVLIQHGNAWILEKENIYQLRFHLIASGIPGNAQFNYVQFSKRNNYLFLGSSSKGIYIIHKNQLVPKQSIQLNINAVNAFYSQIELPNGNILTSEGKIFGNNTSQNFFNIDSGFFKQVFLLNDSLLVYAAQNKFFIYNRNTFVKEFLFQTVTNVQYAFALCNRQLYFVNSTGIGIVNMQNKTVDFIKRFDEKKSVLLSPFDMIEIAPNKLALATCEGLLRFDTNTKAIDTILKLPSICIRSLYTEGDYLFIGTYGGGFYVMKNGVIKQMPPDVNDYLKFCHCFIKDDKDFCWISTNNGLFKVQVKDIIEAYEKNLPQIFYYYFGKDDGMQTTEMNGGCMPCALKLANGIFSFPTMDGLLWVNPLKTNLALPSGKIFIDNFLVDGKEKNSKDGTTIQLPVNSNKLEIRLAVNAWCKKENLYMSYKLNDDKWLPVEIIEGEPKIGFSNLSYGSYTLSIRKMDGFGTNNFSYTKLFFVIATPFYQQWWFIILGVLLLAAFAFFIFKISLYQYAARERKLVKMVDEKTMDLNLKNIQLEKNNRIKLRLISIISHDIMTPLKFMHYAGKALVENKDSIKEEAQRETINEITQTAKDMEQLSSQILNWITYHNPDEHMQKEEFDLHLLTEMVCRVLQFSAKQKNTKLQNDVPLNYVVCQYLEATRVMLYNLVLNSLNFTKDGVITIHCISNQDKIILHISDTGNGMTKEQIYNIQSGDKIIASINVDNKKGTGLGYLIIKDLLKIMNGALTIKSIKNAGTTVSVSLPRL